MFVCSQLQHTYSAVFLLLVTAASDLLVQQILLNSVLVSPVVSGGVQPNSPRQTPLGHIPPCLLPFVGRLGSGPWLVGWIKSGVRLSVSFQQKYPPGSVPWCPTAAENGVMTKGVVSGGWPPSPAYNVELVTNTSSSSCANNGRRYHLNHAIVVKLYHPCILNFPETFAYLINELRLFRHNITFWLLRLINTLTSFTHY